MKVLQEAEAIHSFKKERDEDLDIQKGETIQIMKKFATGWALGKNQHGMIGSFPLNFVKIAEDENTMNKQ